MQPQQPHRRKSRTITFSLPLSMAEQVKEVLREESRTMSELLREALRLYLEGRKLRLQERLQWLRFSLPDPASVKKETTMSEKIDIVAPAFGTREWPDLNLPSNTTVYGIDFTSRPTRRKPIVCVECLLDGNVLRLAGNPWHYFENFTEFEYFLSTPSPSGLPWIAGIDFPFGMPLRFIENAGWPTDWGEYVKTKIAPLSRKAWREVLDSYKCCRPTGDKEHLRVTDAIAGSLSPQKQYGIPVALMFYEGAPRLKNAGVMIPGLQEGSPDRVVVESYPGVAVRNLVGEKPSYKTDSKGKQTAARLEARRAILGTLRERGPADPYFIEVQGTEDHAALIEDGTGDHLDALLCAVQAAWAWRNGPPNFGLPTSNCPAEGWIADPTMQVRL